MPLDCQLQYLAQFGFKVPDVQNAIEVEQAQNAKITDKNSISQEEILPINNQVEPLQAETVNI